MAIASVYNPKRTRPNPRHNFDDEGYLIADGEPVAKSDTHYRQGMNSISALDVLFRDRPDVYVAGNNFIHYRQGDYTKYVSPDAYVVFGVEKKLRDNFKIWEEGGHSPAIVFEFTSKKTRREDTGPKRSIYQDGIGVPEYILFDPKGEYLKPPLQGYRLDIHGAYQPIPVRDGRMYSEQLDLYMVQEGKMLRFFDAKTGEFLRTLLGSEEERREAEQRAKVAEQRADAEVRARQEMEIQMVRMQAELDALRQKSQDIE